MRRVSAPLLDLREGEALPALKSFLLLTLIIAGHTLLETARDALFLGKLPASRLALVYGVIAAVALAVAAPNARFVRRFGESRALLITLLVAAYGTIALYLPTPTPTLVFGLYLWSAFLGTVVVVQFWMFLAHVFTPSQGKRLFGPIAAGGVVGAVAGAGSAAIALTYLPVRALLPGAATAFILAALLSTAIDAADLKSSARQRELLPPFGEPEAHASAGSRRRGIALLFEHPYLLRLALLTTLSTAAVLGTDYLFKADAARHVAPEDLGAYFAKSYAAFNAAALVVQVLIAGPLVRRAGVAQALLVMPLLLLCGAGAILITGAPVAVLLTKGVDGALRHSLHRLTNELLGLPIPGELRARVKPVIDGVLTRAAQAMMAGAIFLLATRGRGAEGDLVVLIAALAFAWLAAALVVRGPHLAMFRDAISRGLLAPQRHPELDGRLIQVVLEALSSPEPARAIAAIDLLVESGQEAYIPSLIFRHESEEVQVRALDLMTETRRLEWAPQAERLLMSPLPERVRIAAVRALAAARSFEALRRCLNDESPAIRAYTAVALTRAQHTGDAATAPLIRDVLAVPGDAGRTARAALLEAIRDSRDPQFSGVLLEMIEAADPELTEDVLLAMAAVREPAMISIFLSHLHIRKARAAIRDALVDLGERAQEALERAMRSELTLPSVRLHIPRTLSRFRNQRAADFLTEQLAVEPSGLVRYKVLRGLGRLVASSDLRVDREAILSQMRRNLIAHLEILALWVPLDASPGTKAFPGGQLVLGLLSDKLRQSLQRAFRLLQIAYRREDIRRAYQALQAPDRRGRSNAMEFLDALLSGMHGPQGRIIHDLLRLVVDELPPREKVGRAAAHVPEPPSDAEAALRVLIRARDTSLAALATYHVQELGLDRLLEEVMLVARDRPSLAEMASAVIGEHEGPGEARA